MILTLRYPHVRDLVQYYANRKNDKTTINILINGISSENEATHFAYFIWDMLDQMAIDKEQGVVVLGGTDNTQMAPDVSYEMDALMEGSGYGKLWEKISNEV